jgi:uncharacterized membrane protein
MRLTREDSYTAFGRLSILILSIEWILFGSMHFSMFRAALDQVPPFVPLKTHAVIVTGILEVAAGMLILVPELRKAAAGGSLALLVLLAPAMYYILYSPEAVQRLQADWAVAFRVVLIPNNIFLAICSVYLWRHPQSTLAGPAAEAARPRARRPMPFRALWREPVPVIVAALLLMANCAGFLAIAVAGQGSFGLVSLWAMSCIATGALIGFLFGVPRLNPAAKIEARLLPNTNVEAVSDWLTKILVGVGLVNFAAIGGFVARLSQDIARATSTDPAFGTALIVYFFMVGVIEGYVLTRIFLAPEFAEES